ncbi:2-methylcitrate dehydratase PrpD [Hyphomicrobiales bacterium]|nr:2-methylcitrate dehydratase PrpD [Hyphomicrobiales bacterium]CAH1690738.1 2-methylcitrate dehydratase PrpD [Hyphomicrobiales bacterium]
MALTQINRPVMPAVSRNSTTLSSLANYVLGLAIGKKSETTLQFVRDCVLDCVTAAVAGSDEAGARSARAVAGSAFGTGKSSVWFSGQKVPASAAVLANCNAASILDLDDGHRAATGHPGAAIIPACLAVAEEIGATWVELAAAIVVGYEVAVRVAAGRDFSRLDTMSTGKWCNYGVAAAVGRLRGLNREQLIQAMAIAGVHGPNQSAAGYSKVMGNHAKEGIPWSTLTGILAVDLAVHGFTGPTDILDHPAYFEASNIVRGLGRSAAIERVYFKPYSCCRWAHAAIDGLTDILERDGLRIDAVEEVEVHTFARALKLNNDTDPETLEGAQYSVPFVLGVAAEYGREALLPLSEELLHDPRAVSFARRITLLIDADLDNRFPETTAARVILKTATGQHMREVLYPLGDPDNPMARHRLMEKFDAATRKYDTAGFKAAFAKFDAGDYHPLIKQLQAPLRKAS